MSSKVWVYIDQYQGEVLQASWEVITAGRSLAGPLGTGVTALVIGKGVEKIAQEAIYYGADEVLVADDSKLADYRPEPYASLITSQAVLESPQVILYPGTGRGRELAAMNAVDLKTGVMPDAIALEVKDGSVVVTRPVYGGKVLTRVVCSGRPQLITIRRRVFERPLADTSLTGVIKTVDVEVKETDTRAKVVESIPSGGGVSLADANVVVAGGRGVASNPEQGVQLISELAGVLNGAVGASRSVVDAGYISYEHQVGQTGKIVAPNLYIACGLSGSIQHMAGMRNSKLVVAINTDPDAPIFTIARYGILGDLFTFLPLLKDAFSKRLEK